MSEVSKGPLRDPFKKCIFEIVKRIPSLFFVLLFFTAQIAAQHSILYQVNGKKGEKSYILAVSPFDDERTYNFSDSVYAAFDRSQKIVPLYSRDSLYRARLDSLNTLPNGVKNYDLFNNSYFGKLDQLIHSLNGGSAWQYEHWSPLHLQLRLEEWRGDRSRQSDFFEQLARYQGKNVESLLPPEEFAAALNEIPLEWQADMLAFYIRNFGNEDYRKRFLNQYLGSDMDRCSRVDQEYLHAADLYLLRPQFVEKASAQIKNRIGKHRDFYLIQASLLGGEDGLLAGLRTQGLKIKEITPGFVHGKPAAGPGGYFFSDTLLYTPGAPERYFSLYRDADSIDIDALLDGWYQLVSYRGGFSVRMPGPPEVVIEQLPREAGGMTMYLYRYEDVDKRQLYIVSFFDYPREKTPRGDDAYFTSLIAQTVRHFNGLLLKEKNISTPEYPGREIELSTDDNQIVRIRFYLIGRRLYQVILGAEDLKAFSDQNRAFFQSFRLFNVYKKPWLPIRTAVVEFELPQMPEIQLDYLPYKDTTAGIMTISEKSEESTLQYQASLALLPNGYRIKNAFKIYRQMAYAAIHAIDGILLSEYFDETKDFRTFYMEAGGKEEQLERNRFFIDRTIIIHLLVLGPSGSAESAYANRFLNGYRLFPLYR